MILPPNSISTRAFSNYSNPAVGACVMCQDMCKVWTRAWSCFVAGLVVAFGVGDEAV